MFESLPQWMNPRRNRIGVQRKYTNSSRVPKEGRKYKRIKSKKGTLFF